MSARMLEIDNPSGTPLDVLFCLDEAVAFREIVSVVIALTRKEIASFFLILFRIFFSKTEWLIVE
jgi:hypothetical protein